MSLYSALYAGVSGLNAQSSAMAAVADNITNINTIGYKGVEAQFKTMVTDGRARSSYSAGGVVAAPIAMISKQGMMQASSNSTDIAIDGKGFFVTRTAAGGQGEVAFTRAGSFRADEEGYLKNPATGLYLYGYRLDAEGKYVNTGNLDDLEAIRVSDLTGTAAATSRIQARINLNTATDVSPAAAGYTQGDLAKYAADNTFTPKTENQFQRSFTVYDQQGGSHTLNMAFLKTGPNAWKAEIYSSPPGDIMNTSVTPAVKSTNGFIAGGDVKFKPDGSLDLPAGSWLNSALNITYSNQAASVPIKLELGSDGKIDGLTQFGQPSSLISGNTDGGTLGNLSQIEITKEGGADAVFDDGTTRSVFQLPLATFQNPDGLTRVSGNAYNASRLSGGFTLNEPGELGAGAIAANSLEASTVDLAGEFTNMIRFQRAYSASSKIITTVDDMLREVSDLKR